MKWVLKKGVSLRHLASLLLIFLVVSLLQTPNINAAGDYSVIQGAHRGNSVDYTENTLEAFAAALNDDKYNFIEFDLQYTKDKQIIVFHDQSLFRMQSQLDRIHNLNYDELETISSYHIPLYEEVMDLIGNQKKINIEIKSQGNIEDDQELADFVINDCREREILDLVMISSISANVVKYVSETYPEIKTGMIYLVHPVTYLSSAAVIEEFYLSMDDLGTDYILLHAVNLKNLDSLIELKPEGKTLIFWYLYNDQIYILQKDQTDRLW